MRLICTISAWRLFLGLALTCILLPRVPRLCGNEPAAQGRTSRNQPPVAAAQPPLRREPIRIAQRREQNSLDPSVEETPALPPATSAAEEATAPPPAARGGDPRKDDSTGDRPTAWPRAVSLLNQLDDLSQADPTSADWAERVKTELDNLVRLDSMDDRSSVEILRRLAVLAEESRQLARELTADDARSKVLRAGFAIVRRLAVWEPAFHAAAGASANPLASGAMMVECRQRLRLLLPAVELELPRTGDALSWRNYLLLDHLRGEIEPGGIVTDSLRSLSREVLHRIHSTQLSEVQAAFLQAPAFRRLVLELRTLATEPANLAAVLAAIEDYEQQERTSAAVQLADVFDRLRWSTDPQVAQLAEAINTYYRNSNVRVAVSAELVNRLLPGEQTISEPVVDRIQNADVEGHSQTSTKVRLVLLPTRGQWEFGIEANGDVASNTTSSSGPARFHQWGWSNFRARKKLTVDRRGIRLFQAEAEANADTQLNDFETEFDGIPILSSLARAVARNQYEQKSPAARHEVEGKISYRASAELDKQVAERLEKGKRDFQRQMVRPLQELDLEPTAVDMETTEQRLIARYRLAGRDQVSAYTPRPQAPGDSLLSVQIHESALNNLLSHLKLEGRRVDLVTLFKEMNERFSDKKVPVPEDIPDDVFVTFADEDPVRIDCQDGRVRLTIQLKELERQDVKSWKNLTVRAHYVPDPNQLDANLMRDGIIEIPSPRVLPDRPILAGIFGKVLSRNRKLNLINERISKSPQLSDQQVTQFVIHDGWIGVALGPKTPERQAQLRKAAPQ